MMISQDFSNALKEVSALMGNRLKWAVVGSTNLALQGLPVTPNDLDIAVFISDLRPARALFRHYSPTQVDQARSSGSDILFDFRCRIGNIPVQVFSDHDSGSYSRKLLSNRIVRVKLGTSIIPCFTLEAEAQAYDETGRPQKSVMIKEFLKKHADN